MAPETRLSLIASDLDGTLLDTRGQLSARARSALTAAADAGCRVVFATGRPWSALGTLREERFLDAVLVQNGAVRYDPASGRRTVGSLITPGVLGELFSALSRARQPGLAVAVQAIDDEGDVLLAEPAYPGEGRYRHVPSDALAGVGAARVLIRHSGDAAALRGTILAATAGAVHVTYSVDEGLLELSAAGVTKGAALAAYAAEHSIGRDEVVAFGDMPNDLEMLHWAGTSVAVGNAHPLVQLEADVIVETHAEDGVARYVETLLRGQGSL